MESPPQSSTPGYNPYQRQPAQSHHHGQATQPSGSSGQYDYAAYASQYQTQQTQYGYVDPNINQYTSPVQQPAFQQPSYQPPQQYASNSQIAQAPTSNPLATAPPATTMTYSPLSSIQTTGIQSGYNYPNSSTTTSGPATAQTRSGQRINPAQVPSPVSVEYKNVVRYTPSNDGQPPPLATAQVITKDEGNCNPRYMRMTMYNIPCTNDLQTTSHIPFGVIIQPLADPGPGEEFVPVIDFGGSGPLRCHRCRTYINPFVHFTNGGKQYMCKMCDYNNEVPSHYFSPLDFNGKRHDIASRPELSRGTVEYEVSQVPDYVLRPLSPLKMLFAIDVSYVSISSGMFDVCVQSIRNILATIPEGSTTRVGIMTYDTSVHFYNLSPALQQPQMLVLADTENVFIPIGEDVLFVKYHEAKRVIESLLTKLPTMFAASKVQESCFGAAVQAAADALRTVGGKLIAFQSVLPSAGNGKLKKRDDPKAVGTDKEKTLLVPQDPFYTTLAADCAKHNISIDLFLFTSGNYVDVATLSTLSRSTGGQVYFYYGFNPTRYGDKFQRDLYRCITRNTGYDALMRVRTSKGVTVDKYIGNYTSVDGIGAEISVAGIDSDKSFCVQLKHDDKLEDKSDTIIQCALLYTTSKGERRVRVHTLSVPSTTVLANVFKSADLDAVMNCLIRSAVFDVANLNLATVRSQLIERCIEVLTVYRKFCATPTSSGQLILPEALKFMPIYTQAVVKNLLLRPGSDIFVDERAYLLSNFVILPPFLTTPFIYPRMYAVHDIPVELGSADQDGHVRLPPLLRLSTESLASDGAYLLEDGQRMFLWLGKALSPLFIADIFGLGSANSPVTVDSISPNEIVLTPFENPTSVRFHNIINFIRQNRFAHQHIQIVKQGDALEHWFHSYLYDDKMNIGTQEGMSYVDFLCHVHKQIQNKLS